ncbi:MAG: MFS transporter [Planctomycetaceae bacterium]|nr:MFS transporter [Planctomycetaceae bacterium]
MRYLILILLCVMACIAYIQRAAVSVPAETIAKDLSLADLALNMGMIQSIWYLGYAIFQMPAGWLADQYGSRRVVVALCVLWSLLTLATGFSFSFHSLAILWFLMGAAQAGAFPCAAKAIGQQFDDSSRAFASGMLAAGMAVGGAAAPVLAGKGLVWLDQLTSGTSLQTVAEWRLLLMVFAIPGIVWSLSFLTLVPQSCLPPSLSSAQKSGLGMQQILSNPNTWLLCLQQFFRAAGMVFFLTWFPVFLQKTRGVSEEVSGTLTGYAGIGGVFGSLLGGITSDFILKATNNRWAARQGLAILGMSICSVLILASSAISDVRLAVAIIGCGAFAATFGGVSGYTVAIEFGGKRTATVFSLMNMFGNIGAMLFPLVAGLLVRVTGQWSLMLYLFAGIMAVDAVCWALLNPKKPVDAE